MVKLNFCTGYKIRKLSTATPESGEQVQRIDNQFARLIPHVHCYMYFGYLGCNMVNGEFTYELSEFL